MSIFKSIARTLLPQSMRLSSVCPRLIRQRVVKRTEGRIASGPFRGMKYLSESVGSVLEPKLLGIYEKELHGVIDELIGQEPAAIIDIGAAEGYYAVGLAIRLPNTRVTAFESETSGQDLLRDLAVRNGVFDRIQILGTCNPDMLRSAFSVAGRVAVICDVEGAEAELLDPHHVPQLAEAAILVELHPRRAPGVKDLILGRFRSTHTIVIVRQELRSVEDFPYREFPVNLIPKAYVENAVSEFRQPWEDIMEWLWMTPKTGQGNL